VKVLKAIAALSMLRVFGLAILAGVGYFFLYYDDGSLVQSNIESVKATIAQETTRRAGIEKTMKKEEEMRGNLLQLKRNLEVVKSKIPSEFKDTQMSSIINNASVASKVNVIELTTAGGLGTKRILPPLGKNSATVRPEDLIEEVKFKLTVVGSYDGFIQFLDFLTKEEKVIKIRNFSIERNSSGYEDDNIKFRGEVVGFKQVASASESPPPNAPAPAPPVVQ
jgi:Tfp pilus assembly protein PilO